MTLAFDPTFRVGILAVRWETLGLAATVFVALLVAAFAAGAESRRTGLPRLRLDDLFFLVLAAVAGAVVGGRLVQGFDYLDYYRAHPAALVDPSQGSLSLLGAVLGGTLAVAYMCRLLQVSAGRWLDVAAIPLLLTIGLGKAAYLLGGGGQGLPSAGPFALAFAGTGPWLSPQPAIPAYASQLLEAAWALLGIPLLLALGSGRVRHRLPGQMRQTGAWLAQRSTRGAEVDPGGLRFGYRFLAALGWWLVGRVLVAFTWRDPAILGALDAEQAAALVVLAGVLLVGAWWAKAD